MWPAGDAGQSRESSKPVHVLWGPWQPHGSPSRSCPSSFTSMTHAYYQAYISNTTPPLPGFCDLLYRKQFNGDTQSGILCCISSVMCGQPVSHSSLGEKKKGNRVTDRAPFCVIQDGFNLRLSRVIICESKRERCKAFAVLPSRWLAWQAANVHLRHKPAPLFEILETQTQGFI